MGCGLKRGIHNDWCLKGSKIILQKIENVDNLSKLFKHLHESPQTHLCSDELRGFVEG